MHFLSSASDFKSIFWLGPFEWQSKGSDFSCSIHSSELVMAPMANQRFGFSLVLAALLGRKVITLRMSGEGRRVSRRPSTAQTKPIWSPSTRRGCWSQAGPSQCHVDGCKIRFSHLLEAMTQLFSGSLFPFFGGCPTKIVFPKKGSLFFQGH